MKHIVIVVGLLCASPVWAEEKPDFAWVSAQVAWWEEHFTTCQAEVAVREHARREAYRELPTLPTEELRERWRTEVLQPSDELLRKTKGLCYEIMEWTQKLHALRAQLLTKMSAEQREDVLRKEPAPQQEREIPRVEVR